jgi:hypothetical protein
MSPKPRANAADGNISSNAAARLEPLATIKTPREVSVGKISC